MISSYFNGDGIDKQYRAVDRFYKKKSKYGQKCFNFIVTAVFVFATVPFSKHGKYRIEVKIHSYTEYEVGIIC